MEEVKNTSSYEGYYNESAFWSTVKTMAKKAGKQLIYLALLLYYTLMSSSVSLTDRAIIIGALGYFIFPFDIIPDYIPFIGYTDDLSILYLAYKKVKANINNSIRIQAKNKLGEFFGSYNSRDIDGY